jgi:hypothetical protein
LKVVISDKMHNCTVMLGFFILKEYQKLKQEIDALKMLLKDPIVDQKTQDKCMVVRFTSTYLVQCLSPLRFFSEDNLELSFNAL